MLMVRYKARNYLIQVETTVIGRSSACSLVVNGPGVSRNHVSLHRSGDAIYARDLGSANGTRLNGKRLPKAGARLKGGDVLTLGSVDLEIREARELSPLDVVIGSPRRGDDHEHGTIVERLPGLSGVTPSDRPSFSPR
jgi:pSer/pThr/pTyr-binding forkhead associated (FHA) protein